MCAEIHEKRINKLIDMTRIFNGEQMIELEQHFLWTMSKWLDLYD